MRIVDNITTIDTGHRRDEHTVIDCLTEYLGIDRVDVGLLRVTRIAECRPRLKIVSFGHPIESWSAVVSNLANAKLVPANLTELLAARLPQTIWPPSVVTVALGEVFRLCGRDHVAARSGYNGINCLQPVWLDGAWSASTRFLAAEV